MIDRPDHPFARDSSVHPCIQARGERLNAASRAMPLRDQADNLRRVVAIVCWLMAVATATVCFGQAKPKTPERPKMKTVELVTKDNVTIRAFYFPSDRGKDAVPVIVMHEWQGQASPYAALVKALNDAGCAVIVPEFRGHGLSKQYDVGNRKVDFDLARMGKADIANIIAGDMEAVKKFLREENNQKNLNLNALVLIGIRESAVIAAHWAVRDLNFPSVGAIKQGQDVKALVLVSPEKLLKGYSLDETLQDRYLWQLPFMIVVGEGSRQAGDADRFYKRLETMKKKAARGAVEGLAYESVRTSLDGPALVNESRLGVIDKIKKFVVSQLVEKTGKIEWVERP